MWSLWWAITCTTLRGPCRCVRVPTKTNCAARRDEAVEEVLGERAVDQVGLVGAPAAGGRRAGSRCPRRGRSGARRAPARRSARRTRRRAAGSGRRSGPAASRGARGASAASTRRIVAMSFAVPHRRSGRFGICLRTGSHVSQSPLTSGSCTPLTSRPCHGRPIAREGPPARPAGRRAPVAVGGGTGTGPGGIAGDGRGPAAAASARTSARPRPRARRRTRP